MQEIELSFNGKESFLVLKGRLDSTNAESVQKYLDAEMADKKISSILIDAQSLEYISSAGLRVILSLKKKIGNLKMINVKSEVYEILEMTGFTQMMEIQKAYKQVSVEGCKIIGEGEKGIVYRINADTVVKVYKNTDSLDEIKKERELARKAFVHGIPTSISYDIVQVDGKFASMFEMLESRSLAERINEEPDRLDELAKASAALLKKIHSLELKEGEMPDARAECLDRTERLRGFLSDEAFEKLILLVQKIPYSRTVIHGDFHVKNQRFLNSTGELMLIDMDTLCQGDPLFDFAVLYNAYIGREISFPGNSERFFGISKEQAARLWNKTLEFYFEGGDGAKIAEIKKRAMIAGELRLMAKAIKSYRGTPDGERQIASSKAILEEAIKTADELSLTNFS